jgi:protein phosphatase
MAQLNINLPELSLVVLIGASGSGKSSFARRHFKPTEVLSSDSCRGLVSDDENNQAATEDAFDVLHYIASKRLKNGLLTVVDATNLRPEDRRQYVRLAREYHCLPVAIVLNLPEKLCQERNRERPDRNFGHHVIRNQRMALRRGIGRSGKSLRREGFRHVWMLESEDEVNAVAIQRTPLWNNRRDEHGPFDIIGDVHGCFNELVELLNALDYVIDRNPAAPVGDWSVTPPADESGRTRTAIFLGDLIDRGPNSPAVLRLVMRMVAEGVAHCVPGNHDIKLLRKLNGKNVQITHGLGETLEQLEFESLEFIEQVRQFIDSLVSHYVLRRRQTGGGPRRD